MNGSYMCCGCCLFQPHGLDLLPACARMLCRLLQSDAALRSTLGNDKQFLEDLLRCECCLFLCLRLCCCPAVVELAIRG